MGMNEAVRTCFANYVTFSGRARRPEYWWFVLFWFLAGLIVNIVIIVWLASPTQPGENRYGPEPSAA